MGWAVGYDTNWQRDVGYGVPSTCDQPDCGAKIDRGLYYVCGSDPMGGEHGCGLYFCDQHLIHCKRMDLSIDLAAVLPNKYDQDRYIQLCHRCAEDEPPYDPTPDTEEWIRWKLTDESWGQWRDDNPEEVEHLKDIIVTLQQ